MAIYKASKNIPTPQKSAKNPTEETHTGTTAPDQTSAACSLASVLLGWSQLPFKVKLHIVTSVPKLKGKSNISQPSHFKMISGKKSNVC